MGKRIKTPLRYPGGKSRALKTIDAYLPSSFTEYREPTIGGGSVFIHVKQKHPQAQFWINDLNPELFAFWQALQQDSEALIQGIWQVKRMREDGKALYKDLASWETEKSSILARAIRFFLLNRITFSGTIEAGGFSQEAFNKRFTDSSIQRLESFGEFLKDVKITNRDYAEVVNAPGKDVFIFLDPPYLSVTKSRLYGKRGCLHTNFDHQRFAKTLRNCPHRWLITYDDCPEVRENFTDAYIYEWELQYGMNNYKQQKAQKGREVMIANYPIKANSQQKIQLNLF
ncbi:MAG: DNA adenine methylase [Jaaginema sp. PMC 1079.18]|nr:DNA adenine methylase [Jaaginema sp. PMC 1080.18]MEC4849985.1 DNA adenine methylase [Jaaginema sp. PMC 1079.18]MEC4865185.1 DNA adenine methylase [Jaaginema sp. PMC 1078.18]